MTEGSQPPPQTENSDPGSSGAATVVPAEIVEAGEKFKQSLQEMPADQIVRTFMMSAVSRTTVGPDPETARILAEAERHAEDNRLAGYRESVKLKDAQSARDQEYRIKRLSLSSRHATLVLCASIAGVIAGVVIFKTINASLGTAIMVVSGLMIKDVLHGKTISGSDSKD